MPSKADLRTGWIGLWLGLLATVAPCFAQTDLGRTVDAASVRVALIGDFGHQQDRPDGESGPCLAEGGCGCHWNQQRVADTLYARHGKQPFQLGLTVGDNFYPHGVKDASDKHWTCSWKRFYERLDIVFYPTLGNHDYQGTESAQIEYSAHDRSWNMPSRYYTFQAGPVRFFALDTKRFDRGQREWLDEALEEHSDARWKVVYGHHPVYSCSYHKNTSKLVKRLLPMLKSHGVDAYLAGHDHDLQYIAVDDIDFLVSGGGGRQNRSRSAPRASRCSSAVREQEGFKFGVRSYGFLEVEADPERLAFRFVDDQGEIVWEDAPRRDQ